MLFAQIIESAARSVGAGTAGMEPLAHLEYERELALKNTALREFWSSRRLPGLPDSVLPSPKPRHYRTTTKRRAEYRRGRLALAPAVDEADETVPTAAVPLLEPLEHTTLYAFLGERLSEPHFRPLAEVLTYAIIRGSYTERCVIFNVCQLDGTVVRKLKILGEKLPAFDSEVTSAFVFFDPTRSRYYLDSTPTPGRLKTKKLFGRDTLMVQVDGHRYLYYPTLFSQVNESMLPVMLSCAREILAPGPNQHLVDLYCGYGLFTHYLASAYAHACGLEASPDSVEAAQRNARLRPEGKRASFRVCRIAGEAFLRHFPRPDEHEEVVVADPPRQGMPDDVIAAVAARAPVKVLLACCGTDEIPRQVSAWERAEYRLVRAIPLDMFAGTPHLETLLLLEPAVRQAKR